MRVQNGPNQLIASLASHPPRAAAHAPYRVGHLIARYELKRLAGAEYAPVWMGMQNQQRVLDRAEA